MGAALVALAIVAPWLVWLPIIHNGAAIDLLGALAIVAAWHGWGRVVARLAGCDATATLTVAWGLAATTLLGGVLLALHIYDARLLVIAGTAVHSADTALRWNELRARDTSWSRFTLIPALLVGLVAIVAVLGSAGHVPARAFDDDGSVIAQVARLFDTGALADAIGYPRGAQLGAHPVLAGLVTAFADATQARLVDRGLGLALVLALACATIRPRDASGALFATLLSITACALSFTSTDLAPLWIPAALILALDATVTDGTARQQVPVALLAGALAALRVEYAAMACAFVIAAWWPGRSDRRRFAVLAGGFTLVLLPFLIAHARTLHGLPAAARAVVEPTHHVAAHTAMFVGIAAVTTPLALLVVRALPARTPRVLAIATVIGVAGVTAFGERPFATQLYWPLAIAAFIGLVTAVAAQHELGALALMLALLACVLVRDGQTATGADHSWRTRVFDLLTDVAYARDAAPEGGDYARVLEPVPAGDRVAVWVGRPELLDYARFQIIDLRAPRAARDTSAIGRLVTASDARWLLLEDEAPAVLDTLAHGHRVTATVDGVTLIDLRN